MEEIFLWSYFRIMMFLLLTSALKFPEVSMFKKRIFLTFWILKAQEIGLGKYYYSLEYNEMTK